MRGTNFHNCVMHELLAQPREHVSVFIVKTGLDYRRCRSPRLPARLLPKELPVRRGLALLAYHTARAEVAERIVGRDLPRQSHLAGEDARIAKLRPCNGCFEGADRSLDRLEVRLVVTVDQSMNSRTTSSDAMFLPAALVMRLATYRRLSSVSARSQSAKRSSDQRQILLALYASRSRGQGSLIGRR